MSTLRELYNLLPDESGLNTGLIIWYNKVINKTYDQLDVTDVAKMCRQGLLLDVAIERAIDLVLINPYDGEYNDGGLIELIATLDLDRVKCERISQLKLVIEKVSNDYTMFDWCTEEDKINFKRNIDLVIKYIEKY